MHELVTRISHMDKVLALIHFPSLNFIIYVYVYMFFRVPFKYTERITKQE